MKTKQCSICGEERTLSHFDYGNRPNRSYCDKCNRTEMQIRRREGKEGTAAWREGMRKNWRR